MKKIQVLIVALLLSIGLFSQTGTILKEFKGHVLIDTSLTIGTRTGTTGLFSTTGGVNVEASGNYSAAFGGASQATGLYAFACGNYAIASGDVSYAAGSGESSGSYSFLLGYQGESSGSVSFATGSNTEAEGTYSFSAGYHTRALSYIEAVFGRYNDTTATSNKTGWTATNHLFTVGNGADDDNRNNAFLILKNGNSYFDADLTIGADAYIHTTTDATIDSVYVKGDNDEVATAPSLDIENHTGNIGNSTTGIGILYVNNIGNSTSISIDDKLTTDQEFVINVGACCFACDATFIPAEASVHPTTLNGLIYTGAPNILKKHFGGTVVIDEIKVYYNTVANGDDFDFLFAKTDNDGTITTVLDVDDVGNGESGVSSAVLTSADITLTEHAYYIAIDVNNTDANTDVKLYDIVFTYHLE